ncbi:MAG: type II toxin-antitoxin system prevent-host-death family antitoxin [Deltaproteobacteria bacterium]|nr:type II toxin-antitoxin system prevent-host-death family antitoxin [Deltaproteobacteria bacterium]
MIINVSEAKAKLSKLVEMACNGEEVIISKNNIPLVQLVSHNPKAKLKLGLLKGQIKMQDDFLEENAEINAMFYRE